MPLLARPVTDERDGLLTFLAQQRDALRASVLGLTDEQPEPPPPPATCRSAPASRYPACGPWRTGPMTSG